ncbi:MAG: type II toxin-antitoxin system Phd/YefM family antitoxin [Desulfovibrio sp.]|nr:MAG: type II toxin-antitoxin system Phd/YefM family antitoxin [Desulfovibrio sp.]
MPIITISKARAKLDELVRQVAENHEPLVIQGKHSAAVLISEGDWNAMQETLHLLSVKGVAESIRKGKDTSLDQCATNPGWE